MHEDNVLTSENSAAFYAAKLNLNAAPLGGEVKTSESSSEETNSEEGRQKEVRNRRKMAFRTMFCVLTPL